MRRIGKREVRLPSAAPSAEALRAAATHQATGQALMAVATTGTARALSVRIPRRMNRHTDEALARAISLNLRRRAARR
jgi:hypothetical protein